MMFHLLLFLTFVLSAHSIFILLPLYFDPGTNAVAWGSVFNAVASNKSVKWQIIINPNSGPGNGGNDSTYLTGVSRLKNYTNVKILGYVDTNETYRSQSAVQRDINTYASWPAKMAVDGIFFDDVNDCNSKASQNYYSNVSYYAYNKIPQANTYVVLNPGDPANPICFNYCNTMVEFEDAQVNYNLTTINIPSGYQSQSAIIIHNSTATQTTMKSMVAQMASNNIGAVYFTKDCCYQAIDNATMQYMVAAVAAAPTSG